MPKSFGEGETCDAEEVECQFPFKYMTLSGESKTATECTNDALYEEDYNDDKTKEDFYWCATRVNADGTMKEGKWARCEMASCKWNEPGGNSVENSGGLNNEVNVSNDKDDDKKVVEKDDMMPSEAMGDILVEKETEEVSNNDLVSEKATTTTTTTTTTLPSTTWIRVAPVTTTTTTRRTTRRTTTQPPPPPRDPGLLARIGNFVNQGVNNIGSNLVSGGALVAAAASPLWIPALVGKKRRKRDVLESNQVDVDKKPIVWHAKMIHTYLDQAKYLYQAERKSPLHSKKITVKPRI